MEYTYSLLYTILALMTVFVGFALLRRDFKKRSSIFLFAMTLASGLWMIMSTGYAQEIVAETPDLFDNVIAYFFAGAVTLMFLFFALTFTARRIALSNRELILIFLPYTFFSGLLYFAPSYVVNQDVGGYSAMTSLLFHGTFLFCNIVYTVAGFSLVWERYQSSAGVFKTILRSMIWMIAVGSSLVFAISVMLYFYQSNFLMLLRLLVLFSFFLLVVLKIFQYYRWNIKPFVAELFVMLVALVLCMQMISVISWSDGAINAMVLGLFGISGYFLIKSIEQESLAKEQIDKLVKDLREVNEELQVLDKRKSEFVKISSHHLKSPLTLIKGYASMILEGSFDKEINSGAKEAIQKIFDASGRLVSIIEDFMDISNIESGKMEYEFADVDLKKLIASVFEEIKVSMEKSGLSTSFNTDEIDGYTTFADAGKLRQVISNLLDNSIKYTPKGEVHLFLKKDKERGKLHLTITDTGVGMSQATIDKLFAKFSRADDANKVNTGGSGLGLYVAKEIMKKHNAKIWVESPGEGKGSTFHLEFEAKQTSR